MLSLQADVIGDSIEKLQVAEGVIPTNGVMLSAHYPELTDLSTAASGTVIGARAVKNDSGTVRVFVGSATKIEELTSATITDRSKAGGYTNTATRWWFSQGVAANEVVATNGVDTIQRSTGTTFSSLANAPKAKIVLTQSEALLALNYDDGTSVPNGIKFTTRGDSTVWTAAAGNEAGNVRLVESPGEIVAGATMNDLVIAWKRGSMYIGRFVGGAEIWQFSMLSPYIGCYGQEAWAATPNGIIFAGPSGVYIFDGAIPRPIDQGVRQKILTYISKDNSWGANVQMSHDEYNGCVFIWVPDISATQNFQCFAYNYREGRWSMPYPMFDGATTYDYGHLTISDLQSVVRDLNVVDYAAKVNSYTTGVGHFVVAGDKKIYNLRSLAADLSNNKIKSRIVSGRFRINAPPNADMTLRRFYVIFSDGYVQNGGFPGDTPTGDATSFDIENYVTTATGTSATATWDATKQRFDVFSTGKQFQVGITGAVGDSFAVKDILADVVPAGAT